MVELDLDLVTIAVANSNDLRCQKIVSLVLCNYYFAPCGSMKGVHLPLSLCEEECAFVQKSCSDLWEKVNHIMVQRGIEVIICEETQSRFNGVSACCSGFGIDTGIIVISSYVL